MSASDSKSGDKVGLRREALLAMLTSLHYEPNLRLLRPHPWIRR